jgi:predicted CopG family antitoxin
MAKLIKVHDNVYTELAAVKKEGETFSEAIIRLIDLLKLLEKVQKEAS